MTFDELYNEAKPARVIAVGDKFCILIRENFSIVDQFNEKSFWENNMLTVEVSGNARWIVDHPNDDDDLNELLKQDFTNE